MNRAALDELEQRVRHDLELLNYPASEWVPPRVTKRGERILDVAIIGGGQAGLVVAFALLREKVPNILILDENADPGHAGPWRTFARMPVLRSPKDVVGMDLGIPSLTARAWYEAAYGAARWAELTRFLPTEAWAEYLDWYRTLLALPYRNNTRVGAMAWDPDNACFRIPVRTGDREEVLYARKIVLATGLQGSGSWYVPTFITSTLSPDQYAHGYDVIDFKRLVGRDLAVLGAGAAAYDNASTALELGAREAHVFCRRPKIRPPSSWQRVAGQHVGYLRHHGDLDDPDKWRFMVAAAEGSSGPGEAPPQIALDRAALLPNFHLHEGCGWDKIERVGSRIKITTPRGMFEVDFVISATGLATDLTKRPELAALVPDIARWKDRYAPPADLQHEEFAQHAYLGNYFELQEKRPGTAPFIESVFLYNFGCLVSLGFAGGNIPGMKYGTTRLVWGITRQLYRDDVEHHFHRMLVRPE